MKINDLITMKYITIILIIFISCCSKAKTVLNKSFLIYNSDTIAENLRKEIDKLQDQKYLLKVERDSLFSILSKNKEIMEQIQKKLDSKLTKDSIATKKKELKDLQNKLVSNEKKHSEEINKANSNDSTKSILIANLNQEKNSLLGDKNSLNKEQSEIIKSLKYKYEPTLDSLSTYIDETTLKTEKQILETLKQNNLIGKIDLLLKYNEGFKILNQKFNQASIDKYLNSWPKINESEFKKLFEQRENIKLYSAYNEKLFQMVKKGMEISKVEEKTANTRAAQKLNTMSQILSMYSGEIEYRQYPYLDLVISEFLREIYNSGSPKEDLETLKNKL